MRIRDLYDLTTTASWITEPKTDTQYAIEKIEDMLTIKFQGSVSKLDWFYNFLFLPLFLVKPYHHMPKLYFVHRGFLKKYKAVRTEIQKAVYENLEMKIRILGYSQGAALALLAHEDIRFTFGIQSETTVFGCPRVFSLFGYKMLNDRLSGVTRIENGNDIVTRLPFAILFFRHYGKRIHIGKKRNLFRFSTNDHLPHSYRASVEE